MKKFFGEVKAEFAKVVWPAKKEVINSTALVIGLSLAIAVLLGVFDGVFVAGLNYVIGK